MEFIYLYIFYYTFFIYLFNHMFFLFSFYFDVELDDNLLIESFEKKEEIKNEKKYEEKYLEDIRKLNKEYVFDEREKKLLEEMEISYSNINFNSYKNIKKEIEINLCDIELKIKNIENESIDCEEENESIDCEEENESIESLLIEKNKLILELNKINYFLENDNGIKELLNKSKEKALQFIINQRIEKLNNCYVMETTPQGNVIMIYDNKCKSFKYYSDNTIPYRYLEVVSRKYVKFFHCRPLYVDMENELKLAEEKLENETKKEEEESIKNLDDNILKKVDKKNVFTKFKSYNKEGTTGRVNKGVPPKNSIPIAKKENNKILLKENANRYTYEGKIANFSFLKKIDRKIVDKKYGLTFSDFKKIQNI